MEVLFLRYDFNPDWFRPETVDEATSILKEHRDTDLHILAGGTDLNVRIRNGQFTPERIMDITGIKELSSISLLNGRDIDLLDDDEQDHIMIGATATMDRIIRSVTIKNHMSVLAGAASEIGSPLIRNTATIGGNVMNASPAADMSTALLALDARAVLVRQGGKRIISMAEMFTGVCTTCTEKNELLSNILVPIPAPYAGAGFFKLKQREALALAIVNSCATLKSDGHIITGARLAVGAVAVTPLVIEEATSILVSKTPAEAEGSLSDIAEMAKRQSRPITDVRGSAEYRKEMVRESSLRSLREALESLKMDIKIRRRGLR